MPRHAPGSPFPRRCFRQGCPRVRHGLFRGDEAAQGPAKLQRRAIDGEIELSPMIRTAVNSRVTSWSQAATYHAFLRNRVISLKLILEAEISLRRRCGAVDSGRARRANLTSKAQIGETEAPRTSSRW